MLAANSTNATAAVLRRGSHRTRCRLAIALLTGFVASACGGGGSSASVPAATPPPPSASGSTQVLRVRVVDPFGRPLPGMNAQLGNGQQAKLTDADGLAQFTFVPPKEDFGANAWGTVDGIGQCAGVAIVAVPMAAEVTITVEPMSITAIAVTGAGVDAPTIADSGRTLDFSLGFVLSSPYDPEDIVWEQYVTVQVADCSSSASPPRRCVAGGPAGTSYRAVSATAGGNAGDPLSVSTIKQQPRAYSVALLVDQSARMASLDRLDLRLFAAKYFMTFGSPADSLAFGAFAASDAGLVAQIPQTPLALFPIDNPTFGAFDGTLFDTVDDLGSLEGGASPLYAALDRAIDFTIAHAPAAAQRAIFVLTAGDDTSCGADDTGCRLARQAVAEKARASDIAIVTLGRSDQLDHDFTELSAADGLSAIVDPADIGTAVRVAAEWLGGTTPFVGVARFRIQADRDGAFVPGSIVNGNVRVCVNDWGCNSVVVPFSARLP